MIDPTPPQAVTAKDCIDWLQSWATADDALWFTATIRHLRVSAGLLEALEAIRQYGSDTLSGRSDGPDDRAWHRGSVTEMTRRARLAVQAAKGADHD